MPRVSNPLFDESDSAFFRVSTSAIATQAGEVSARAALQNRRAKIDRLRQLWRKPYTMQEIQQLTGFALASVCSLKAAIGGDLMAVDSVERLWPDGRVTRRTVWQIVDAAPGSDTASR